MLELSMVKSKMLKNGLRWFVDEKQGKSMVGLFSAETKEECLDFMRDYRHENPPQYTLKKTPRISH